jgi:adenine-specific DNA-methyltransferase
VDDVTLLQGDCLDILPTLEAGSVDAIVTDPPFFRTSREAWDRQWDTAESYLEWLGRVADEWKRLLAPNGSLYVFASPRMAARVECLIAERFSVINAITWQKDFPCWALKYGAENFRGFVEMSERIIFAEHENMMGHSLASWCETTGKRFNDIDIALGYVRTKNPNRGTEIFRRWVEGDCIPSKEDYIRTMKAFGRRDKDEMLENEYRDIVRPFSAREDAPHTDVWTFKPVSQAKLMHPCQKPLPLLQHILSVSTRPVDLVLDCFAGSGSTLVACMKAGRRCVGIEIDPRYTTIIERRVKAAETPLFQVFGVDILGE